MRKTHGFTLLEILVVVGIVGILGTFLVPNLVAARSRASDGAALGYLRNCVTYLESSRDAMTGKISINPASCDDSSLSTTTNSKPGSVVKSEITIDSSRDFYIIKVYCKNGQVFEHNGYTFFTTGS